MSCDSDFRFTEFHRETRGVLSSAKYFNEPKFLDKKHFRNRVGGMIEVLGEAEGNCVWTMFYPVHVSTLCSCVDTHLELARKRQVKAREAKSRNPDRPTRVPKAEKAMLATQGKDPLPLRTRSHVRAASSLVAGRHIYHKPLRRRYLSRRLRYHISLSRHIP